MVIGLSPDPQLREMMAAAVMLPAILMGLASILVLRVFNSRPLATWRTMGDQGVADALWSLADTQEELRSSHVWHFKQGAVMGTRIVFFALALALILLMLSGRLNTLYYPYALTLASGAAPLVGVVTRARYEAWAKGHPDEIKGLFASLPAAALGSLH